MSAPRLNPLSRRPRSRRLVVAVRGAAGTGKSVFAASLADAGLGRLCFFDTERKARFLPGADGARFDALEIEHADELPEFVDWALGPEGQAQGYGCYALDSWAMYFGRKHRASVEAVRARTGDPLAKPSADDLRNDQLVLQEVLRRLCVDAGACVVITDQIAAKGEEDREENEMGRVLPMTASGLEYFVDVMLELSVRMDGFEPVRVARVVKSNAPDLPVGTEFENPTFADLLARLGEGPQPVEVPATVEEVAPEVPVVTEGPSLDDLLFAAANYGLDRAAVVLAARHYCGTPDLERLTEAQIEQLLARMHARYAPSGDGASSNASEIAARTPRRGRKAA
ncbi:MAG TPA: hypothetical protein VD962_07510 [Rubricoccaceae bacterium]|nr:hypothetical protein [Rubricoccaceae bacterium]